MAAILPSSEEEGSNEASDLEARAGVDSRRIIPFETILAVQTSRRRSPVF